ncbi:hypothetical protein BST61_g4321 [Cercospora zeina]
MAHQFRTTHNNNNTTPLPVPPKPGGAAASSTTTTFPSLHPHHYYPSYSHYYPHHHHQHHPSYSSYPSHHTKPPISHPNPTPSNPTPSNPTPSNPTPSNPTPSNPTNKHVHFSNDTDYNPSSLSLKIKLGPRSAPTSEIKISVSFEQGKLPRVKVKTRNNPKQQPHRKRKRTYVDERDGRGRAW